MKQEALFKKLGNILNELNEQYQFLAQNPEQLSEVELELFLANASFLTDHIQIIKKLNLPVQAPEINAKATQVLNQTVADEEISDEFKDVQQLEAITFANTETTDEFVVPTAPIAGTPVPSLITEEAESYQLEAESKTTFEFILNKDDFSEDDKFDFEEKTTDQLFDRPLSEEEARIIAQKRKVKENLIRNTEELEEDEIGPEPFLVPHDEVEHPVVTNHSVEPTVAVTETVVETTKIEVDTNYKPTVNDMLAGKTGTRLNETSGANITDLKTAISLNDKLLYIKDLFNGYNLAYAEAIDIANKMPNFDAADNFFQKNYAVKNNWAEQQATVDKFYLVLNRRFRD